MNILSAQEMLPAIIIINILHKFFLRVIFWNFIELRVIVSGKKHIGWFSRSYWGYLGLLPWKKSSWNSSLRNGRDLGITGSKALIFRWKTWGLRETGTCPALPSAEIGTVEIWLFSKLWVVECCLTHLFFLHKTLCSVLCGYLWKLGKNFYSLTFLLACSRAGMNMIVNIL